MESVTPAAPLRRMALVGALLFALAPRAAAAEETAPVLPNSGTLEGRVVVQYYSAAERFMVPPGRVPLSLAAGVAARDEAVRVFGHLFAGGAQAMPIGPLPPGTRVLVLPDGSGFGRPGSLRGASVLVAYRVKLFDADGKVLWGWTYKTSAALREVPEYDRTAKVWRLGADVDAAIHKLAVRVAEKTLEHARQVPASEAARPAPGPSAAPPASTDPASALEPRT
jgi:hypothetical protein